MDKSLFMMQLSNDGFRRYVQLGACLARTLSSSAQRMP